MKNKSYVGVLALGALINLFYPEQPIQSTPLVETPRLIQVREKPLDPKITLEKVVEEYHEIVRTLPREPKIKKHYSELVRHASNEYKVDPNIIQALVHVESRGNPKARSTKGAIGLMQITPQTAEEIGLPRGKMADPKYSIRYGTKYFAMLLNKYHHNIVLALAAYNLGPNKVDRILKRNGLDAKGVTQENFGPRLNRITRNYISNVLTTATALDTTQRYAAVRGHNSPHY